MNQITEGIKDHLYQVRKYNDFTVGSSSSELSSKGIDLDTFKKETFKMLKKELPGRNYEYHKKIITSDIQYIFNVWTDPLPEYLKIL